MASLVFVHGFGGLDNRPVFVSQAEKYIQQHKIRVAIHTIAWPSQKLQFSKAGLLFDVARENTKQAAEQLQNRICSLERDRESYYLVAHSLGCLVVMNFLNSFTTAAQFCRGIFFLGAAIPKDIEYTGAFLSKELKIVNYFSPKHDRVLDHFYLNKMGHRAAGAVGLHRAFAINFRCSATHARKVGIVHSDWSQLAAPIIELIMMNEGQPIDAKKRFNIRWAIGKGSEWWNNILEFKDFLFEGESHSLWLQQHKFEKHYRLSAAPMGSEKRKRIDAANFIFPLLRDVGIDIRSRHWPLLL